MEKKLDSYPTTSIKFDRRHTASNEKLGTVELLVSYKRGKLYIPTGVRVTKPQWKNRVVGRLDAPILNKQITDLQVMVTHKISRLWACNAFTLDALRSAMKQRAPKESPAAWITERIEVHPMKESTRVHHRTLPRVMRECGLFTSWADFTTSTVMEFDRWLRAKKISVGTVRNYHKRLKVYIHEALIEGILDVDPYVGFKVEREKPRPRRYLTDEQREELAARHLVGPLAHARDMFLFQCFTGMGYADMAAFNADTDLVVEGGETFIIGHRKKTGTNFRIMLLDRAREILERYNYKLPIMSNQKYNAYLQIAAVGIRDDITSHMGRHTFATWALRNDVPIEVISAMLAHSNISVTQIYAEQQQVHVNEQYRRLDKAK